MSYAERAAEVLGRFFDEFGKDELLNACGEAYAKFDGFSPPLVLMNFIKSFLATIRII